MNISGDFNGTSSVMSNSWKQFKDTGCIERSPGQGLPRAIVNEGRYLSITARHNKSVTDSQLSCDLSPGTGSRVSKVTVSRRLHDREHLKKAYCLLTTHFLHTGELV